MEVASEYNVISCIPAGECKLGNDSTVFNSLTANKDHICDESSRSVIAKEDQIIQYPSMEETPLENFPIKTIPDSIIADDHLSNEDSQYSIGNAHLSHKMEISQFLLDEFQRASLLEEDAELPTELREIQTTGNTKEQQPLVGFNLSDELMSSQKHIYIRPKAPVPGAYRGKQGIQSSGICPVNTDKAKQSPFIFTATNARPRTAGASGALHRGATSRPHTASPCFHSYRFADQHRQEDREAGQQPALIITSAAVVQSPRSQSSRQHTVGAQQQGSGGEGGAMEGDAVQTAPETSGASSSAAAAIANVSPPRSPPAEQAASVPATRRTAPVKEPIYSLRKPHRPVHGRPSVQSTTGGQPPRSASIDVQGKHCATSAARPLHEPASSSSKPSSFPYVKLDPAAAAASAESHPGHPAAVLQLPGPSTAGNNSKAKSHGKMHTVQMQPDCLPGLGAYPGSRNEHADIQITVVHIDTTACFAPAKPIHAKIPTLELNSPARRQRLDLARMAAQVERMAGDPDYSPAPIPLMRPLSGRTVDPSGTRRNSKDGAHKDASSPAWLRDVTPRLPASSRSPEQTMKSPRKVLHVVPSAPVEEIGGEAQVPCSP